MLNEIARIIAVGLALLGRLIRRAFRGLRFLVLLAASIRTTTASAVPGSGRLLNIALYSTAADLLLLAEWWRRSAPAPGVLALIGLILGLAACGAVGWLLHDRTWSRFVLAAVELGRLLAVLLVALNLTPETAPAALIAFGLVERALWTVSGTPGHRAATASAAARYVGALLVPVALVVLAALVVGGLFAPLLAQVALLVALIAALLLPAAGTPKARPPKQRPAPQRKQQPPPKQQAQPKSKSQPKSQPEPAEPDSPDGSYHVYRPSSLNTRPPTTPPADPPAQPR
ncbi:hypothetical protein HDA40_004854 [Hamadaea flava]|uniref:Uncharacterized protein n=1 Tax=Hamadaea flava TaxID=1742688 RepID=A0ABV8LGH1_9ACTN|nr:hypothetical protein [Hamadaea flava]MCP2326347.1 hypothetical protein [Hamadaea flava]